MDLIYQSFQNWQELKQVEHPALNNALEYLNSLITTKDVSMGRTTIDGDLIYINVMECEAKERSSLVLAEKHEQYVDIHMVLEGIDTIGYIPVNETLIPEKAYDLEQDYALYDVNEQEEQLLVLRPGYFAVFYPSDIHRPCLGEAGTKIKKAVLKLHMSLFHA